MKSFTITSTKTFEPLWIHFPFMLYDEQFISIRSKMKYQCKECFKCHHKFNLNEEIGLACFKNIGNKVLCQLCCNELQV